MQIPEDVKKQERLESDHFYATIDQYIRLFGIEHMHRRGVFYGTGLARAGINSGTDWSELHRVLDEIRCFGDWYPAFSASADRFARLAAEAESKERFVTAGEHYLRASLLYSFAILYLREEDPNRSLGLPKKLAYYRKGCRYFNPPAEPVQIRHREISIPAYFRHPGRAGRVPCIIMIDGANSTKEEFHGWSNEFLKRGVASVTFDGPGQGEMAVKHGGPKMELRKYHELVGTIIDYLQARPEVDPGRIGLFGQSCGGWLGAWTAAHEPRVKCLVSMGGFYDFREFPRIPLSVQEEVTALFGLSTISEGLAYMRENFRLQGFAAKIKCPTLILHGARDNLNSTQELRELADEIGPHAEMVVWEDGVHGAMNRNLEAAPLMADWVSEQLKQS